MDNNILYILLATSTVYIKLITTETTRSVTTKLDNDDVLKYFNFSKFNLTSRTAPYRKFNLTRRSGNSTGKWLFKDYLMRFNPNVVFERIMKRKKAQGMKASVEKDFEEIYNGMDITDDLLRLDIAAVSGRRKWRPPGKPQMKVARGKDMFYYRQRIYELIRHAIYQTRNRMVVMQILRKKYRDSPLYKMGFLMSKTDVACKNFYAFAYRIIHPCPGMAYNYAYRYGVIEMMHAEERLNNKWFEIELLIDLIRHNHKNAEEVIANGTYNRKGRWKFED